MKKQFVILLLCVLFAMTFCGCGEKKTEGMQDGTYTAQMSDFSFGWKEYVTITVKNGNITTTEYNAENASGFIKSWDNAYMQTMLHANGTYPNEYTRYYASQFLEGQGKGNIVAITGASSSHGSFQILSQAVLEQAQKGDSSIVVVDTAH